MMKEILGNGDGVGRSRLRSRLLRIDDAQEVPMLRNPFQVLIDEFLGVADNNSFAAILGAAAGAGVRLFLTNASQASQLSGPSLTLNIDLGFFANGAGQLSFGTDNSGNSIWSFTFTAGYGFGGLFHGVTNQTAAGGVRKPCGNELSKALLGRRSEIP